MLPFETPVVILAGGLGSRLGETTQRIPKPMVEVAGAPIMLRIMDNYASYGFKNFVILAGYKSDMIRSFIGGLHLRDVNLTYSTLNGEASTTSVFPVGNTRDWMVTVLDSGVDTNTGGRLLHAKPFLEHHENFFLTYGDALTDVDFGEELSFHCRHSKIGTVLGVLQQSKFGKLELNGERVIEFSEKPKSAGNLISGGFFIFNHGIFDYLTSKDSVLEEHPLRELTNDKQLMCFQHGGFWQCMDTPKEMTIMEEAIEAGHIK